ncbi:inhibitor of Bruton tyrosine kinase isoform X2 [Hemicordylus capensis]|uniref:inhibitor of Bruton tyrosine kinase isoform X2 n=1 Tax=Hemicordylus capensis TaxID=884348 RepID=UPI0023036BAD|nr:inhibitor of Bruton tyrosine kinase isoform X2 [Hemicordylus capensis]
MSCLPDCTLKCRSLQHALDIVSVVTRGSEGQIKAFLTSHCYNAATSKDIFGRNALHLASSCGKKGVLDWLAETNGVDLLAKDKESGWTALHRGIFYGHIDCAWSLLKHGVNLYLQDKEGLSALDLVMKDRPAHVTFTKTDPTDVYTWGNNINFTLGHGSQQSKHHPELLDLFPRNGVNVKQVVLCKFHSVFLSQKGHVYTCGHGQGGRLGHGDEQTCLVPRLVESLIVHHCSQVAAAKDHTVVLTEDGCVYTFGLNTFHQLGILPPPANCSVPRQVQAKNLKGRLVIGVAAGRFHTVLWTKEAVYTMGLNGGQLGYLLDPNGEKCVTAPRQVSALHHKDIVIFFVTASDGGTVCVTERGDIYLLTDYQCKKIASKQLNLRKVIVSGGYLDYRVAPQHLKENGGQRICILALDHAGRVFCWKSANSPMKQCRWVYGRQVYMSDICLNRNEMMFVTQDGEAFKGKWMDGNKNSEKKEIVSNLQNSSNDVSSCDMNNVYERIRLEKLTFVHRAVSVTTDPNGCNFAVLQSDPKTSLYEIPSVSMSNFAEDFSKLLGEAEVMDTIHDVTFQVGTRIFPVHKYILAMRSDFFRKLFVSDHNWLDPADLYRKAEDDVGCDLFVIEKLHPDLFMYLLQYIYTDSCDLLIHGHRPKMIYKEKTEENQDTLMTNLNKITFNGDINKKSALEVYRSNQAHMVAEKKKSKPKSASKKCKGVGEEVNLIKMLQVAAKKYGLANLSSRLDGVRIENGRINVVNRKNGNKPKLNQKKCSYLCDVTMKSIDGEEFPCHKCVLCARLDYFRSMLSSSWIEASCCAALEMPFPSDILQVILDYIYTDEALTIKESQNVEFICNVLVVADQLLMSRLKEICEVVITEKLTLKNAAELLEFAAMYNAEQLKQSCLQFIVLNMAAILETRALDVLSGDVLKDLSVSYRKTIPAMVRRVITPYQGGPDISSLEPEEGETFVFLKEELSTEQATQEALLKKAKAKKKPRRRSDSSGGYNLSDIIQSPPLTGILKLDKTNSVESLPEMLTSDSEGSYVGVNSPRDLQSPDFTAGFHADKIEVKEKMCLSSTVIQHANKEVKICEGTPTQKISPPWCIPSNRSTSASSSNSVIGSFSPSSPPAMDLRTIMEIEENMQKCGTMPKINSGPTSHGSKLSQKQRKLIAMAAKDNSPEIVPDATMQPPTPPKATKLGSAWVPSLHSALPKSFRDLLAEEEEPVATGSSSRKVGVKGIEDVQTQKSLRCTTATALWAANEHSCAPTQSESQNPWLAASLTSPAAAMPVTFAKIVEEELQQEAALIRSREKPLALIQIEERAIQDLLIHYQAFGNPDEFVVVERSPQGPIAAPMWNKH